MSKLRDELLNDPLTIGYAAMTDQAAADSLNAKKTVYIDVPIGTLESYLFKEGLYSAIVAKSKEAASNEQAVCLSLIQAVDSNMTQIDVNHSVFQSGLDILVSAAMLTQAQADAVTALSNKQTTRAQEIGAKIPVRAGYVTTARA